MSVRFLLLRPEELSPWVERLRALERDIEYPIADGADAFRIDHGERYHPFFSEMGESSRFLLAVDGDRVVGTVVGVLRDTLLRAHAVKAVYGADMKIAREYRGAALSRKMLLFGLSQFVRTPEGRSWRFGYVAAMRGAKGDVMRTVRGLHPGRIVHAAARLNVYFAPPERLAALDVRSAPPSPRLDEGLDLSPSPPPAHVEPPGLVSTAGRKDLRLRSTGGSPWPLVHLPYGPARALPSWPHYLRASGEAMGSRGLPGPACFAVDLRLDAHVRWLSRHGIEPGAVCTVYALPLTLRSRGASWLHLATSEI